MEDFGLFAMLGGFLCLLILGLLALAGVLPLN